MGHEDSPAVESRHTDDKRRRSPAKPYAMMETDSVHGQKRDVVRIDGAQGEGGGQILRTSVAAAMSLGFRVHIYNIRARRPKPGLRRQHLAAVQAAAQLCEAEIRGHDLGSRELFFGPGPVRGGTHTFDIGTAGSATLVLQTLLPALLTATARTSVTVSGGTHNPLAPPFEFFDLAYLPLLRRMGARVTARLVRHGFMPAGGGAIRLEVDPVSRLQPLHLTARGELTGLEARIKIANLPLHIAERERQRLLNLLEIAPGLAVIEEVRASGPGNAVILYARSTELTEVFVAYGRRGLPAEHVANIAATEALRYLDSAAAVGTHLADQLLVPLALAGSGTFTTLPPTLHTTTQAKLVQLLFGLPITLQPQGTGLWQVKVGTDNRSPGLVD